MLCVVESKSREEDMIRYDMIWIFRGKLDQRGTALRLFPPRVVSIR